MKKLFFIFALATGALAVFSCSTPKTTISTAPFIMVNGEVAPTLTLTDLTVLEKKVEGSWEIGDQDDNKGLSLSFIEKLAVGNALEESGADVMVAPIFSYIYDGKALVEVHVKGYPGFYKNFRTYVPEKDTCKVISSGEPAIVIYNNKK